MKLLILCLAFFIIGCRSTKSIPSANPLPFPTDEYTVLWKITGNDIEQDCFVMGTMHLIEKKYFNFPESVQKKIKKSDRVILEIANLNQLDAMKYLMLEKGKLTDFFTRNQLDTIYSWAQNSVNMDSTTLIKNFGKMKPFVLSQIAIQLAFDGDTESYEKSIQDIADEKKIQTIGLETIAEQMSFFDKLTIEEQTEMVMASARSKDNGKAETQKLMELYIAQNIDNLYNFMLEDKSVVSNNEASFLTDRNLRWIPKLKEQFSKKKCFVAIGAAHLGGPNGVLRLLQKEGYTITPIKL